MEQSRQKDVLVADDNVIIGKVIPRTLQSVGHCVDVVEDGKSALDALCERHYDLAILNLQMPLLGGLQVVQKFRANGGGIPIVVLTADPSVETIHECELAGVNTCLSKPVSAHHLLSIVSALMGLDSNN